MQEEQRRMYELEYPAPVVKDDSTQGSGPTMIVAMNGYADAGQAVEASADHLKAALENRQLASFNNDELVDYRSRRPAVTIDHDRTVEIENVDLGIKVLRDNSGKPFLLLSGPEPDLRWEAFTDAVVNLVEKFDIQNTIMLYAAPMPVPHTRPTVVTAHGNSPELLNSMVRIESTMMVPGAAALYLERALDKKGRQVAGYTAHVPHYLASSPYPSATLHLLDSVASAVDLNIPLGSLEADVDRVNQQLEEQYDAYMERYRKRHPQAIMPGEEHMPTGEEIGADFEAFLAGLDENPEILSEDIDDREDNFGRDGDSDDEDSGKDMGDDV